MAITSAVCDSFKQEILSGTHLSTDTYKVLLLKVGATGTYDHTFTNVGTPGTGAPSTSNVGTDEAAGTGYTTGGVALAGRATSLSSGTAILTFSNPSWASSTISAIGCIIYNSTQGNKAVAVFDFGGTVSDTNGTFTINIPAATNTTGLVRIA